MSPDHRQIRGPGYVVDLLHHIPLTHNDPRFQFHLAKGWFIWTIDVVGRTRKTVNAIACSSHYLLEFDMNRVTRNSASRRTFMKRAGAAALASVPICRDTAFALPRTSTSPDSSSPSP